jgi:hypothetical protein
VGDPEIPASTVLLTALYVRLLKPPARGNETAEVFGPAQRALNRYIVTEKDGRITIYASTR